MVTALTAAQFRQKFKGLLGVHEDSTNRVSNFVDKMCLMPISHVIKAAGLTTTSSDVAIEVMYVATRDCQLKYATFAASDSATVSASDYFTLQIKKRVSGASGATATVTMATLVGSTAAYTPNTKLQSHAFTLSATSANLDASSGDTIILRVVKTSDTVANGGLNQGPGALVPPGGKIIMEFD